MTGDQKDAIAAGAIAFMLAAFIAAVVVMAITS